MFHGIVGHYVGCGWSVEQITEHLQQFPDGIGGRYLSEHRLHNEIVRSAGKYAQRALPLFNGNGGWVNGWEAKTPQPKIPEQPPATSRSLSCQSRITTILSSTMMLKTTTTRTTVDTADDDDVDAPASDPTLPPLHAHGDADSRPLKSWLVKRLIPAVGYGLLSGQWGAGKTFIVF